MIHHELLMTQAQTRMTWEDFLKKIPEYYDRIVNDDVVIHLLDPVKDSCQHAIELDYDGCCTSYGQNFLVTAGPTQKVTCEGTTHDSIWLSMIEPFTGEWGHGSRAEYDDDPTEDVDIETLLKILSPYDIMRYKLDGQLIGVATVPLGDTTYADTISELFRGDVLIETS